MRLTTNEETTQVVKPGDFWRDGLLISFSGIDGAGKSTQIEKLCEYLAANGIPVIRRAFWDDVVGFPGLRAGFSHKFLHSDGNVGTPEKPANRNDKNTQKWYLTIARSILFLTDAINLRRIIGQTRRKNSGAIVFDRYIYDQLATLPLHRAVARAYARLLLRIAPTPDIAYLLDAIPEAARERKPEYPLDFMHRYRRSYLQLRDIAGLTLIGALAKDEVYCAVRRKLDDCIGSRTEPLDFQAEISQKALRVE
ncbi:MAG: dTMP kinase [Terriglobales bacterium]